MSLTVIRLATSHKDRHNERFSVEALRSMVIQSNEKIIPLGVEHDPRVSPVGRIIQTRLIELEDGEFAIDGIAELFDSGINDLTEVGEREIPVRHYSAEGFKIITDRSYRDNELKNEIIELSKTLNNAEIKEEIKKAVEPISILTIGLFILGSIASGFFGEIGADGYRSLKNVLAKIFRRRTEKEEWLLQFEFTVSKRNKTINIEVILTNPTEVEINNLLDTGFNQLDLLLNEHYNNELEFARIVYTFKDGALDFNYSVLKNGIPLNRTENGR